MTELRQLSAFITWAAWVSVANRPGADFSYTNNFPHDPDVGIRPTPGALLWSALSLLVLLAFGRFDHLGWVTRGHHVHPQVIPGQASAGQRALVKFFVVVTLLFLMQTLIGGALAHYRIEPDDFHGFRLQTLPLGRRFGARKPTRACPQHPPRGAAGPATGVTFAT